MIVATSRTPSGTDRYSPAIAFRALSATSTMTSRSVTPTVGKGLSPDPQSVGKKGFPVTSVVGLRQRGMGMRRRYPPRALAVYRSG